VEVWVSSNATRPAPTGADDGEVPFERQSEEAASVQLSVGGPTI